FYYFFGLPVSLGVAVAPGVAGALGLLLPLLDGDAPLAAPLLLGEDVAPLMPPVDFSAAGVAGSSLAESLPSAFLSSLSKAFSCGEPLASSREIEPSLFLSRSLNVASAALLLAPALAAPDAVDEPVLGDWVALGAAVVPAELPVAALSALSPAAWADSGRANAAATAAAIRVLSFIIISLKIIERLPEIWARFSTPPKRSLCNHGS